MSERVREGGKSKRERERERERETERGRGRGTERDKQTNTESKRFDLLSMMWCLGGIRPTNKT